MATTSLATTANTILPAGGLDLGNGTAGLKICIVDADGTIIEEFNGGTPTLNTTGSTLKNAAGVDLGTNAALKIVAYDSSGSEVDFSGTTVKAVQFITDTTRIAVASNITTAVPTSSSWIEVGAAPTKKSIVLYGTSGTVTASGKLEFTDDTAQLEADYTTFSLSGTGVGTTRGTSVVADIATIGIDYPWRYWRVTVTAISGTGATVYSDMTPPPDVSFITATAISASYQADSSRTTLISNKTAASAGSWVEFGKAPAKPHLVAYGTSGTITITGTLEFTDDAANKEFDTTAFSLTGTGAGTTRGTSVPADNATMGIDYPWRFYRVNVATISGTGAALDGYISA